MQQQRYGPRWQSADEWRRQQLRQTNGPSVGRVTRTDIEEPGNDHDLCYRAVAY